jgi:hypothetical protein
MKNMDGKSRGQSDSVKEYIARMVQAMNNYVPPDRSEVGDGKTAQAVPERSQQER